MAAPPPPSPSPSPSPSPLPPPLPAALPEELVGEILLRFPPDEPASLFRAALVCKPWCRLISGPGFRRRFREYHRTPPMLGMICRGCSHGIRRFMPTTAFRPRNAERAHKRVLDARHGRVLLEEGKALVVWDPITDEEWKVPIPRLPPQDRVFTWAAAVLCSAAGAGGCDHLDCHRRPFIVVVVRTFMKTTGLVETLFCTYSSDAAAWSEPTSGQGPGYLYLGGFVNPGMRSVLVGNVLYFGIIKERAALKFNMQLRQMSWIQLPSSVPLDRQILLTTTEDSGLGLATEQESELYVWSRKDDDEVDARWEQSRVIELKMLLPVAADFTSLNVVGSTDDLRIIFMRAGNAVYAIDLKTYTGRKVCEGKINTIVPYMSFYTPALEADARQYGRRTKCRWLKCMKSLRWSCVALEQGKTG